MIPLGEARISNSFFRIMHPINLTTIESTIDVYNNVAQTGKLNQTFFELSIRRKIGRINLLFNRIRPQRIKRWESLGRAWKYISGSPDADDLKVINSSLNSLVDENNKQIQINHLFEKRMRNLTKTFNSLLDNEQNLEKVTFDSLDSLNFIFEIDELLYYLEIIEESITLAGRSIPSSRIIHPEEFSVIRHTLNDNGFRLNSVDDMLNIASAYAVYNNEMFMYTLKIPKIKDVQYKIGLIEPVIANNLRIHLTAQFYIEGQNAFMSKNPCPKMKDLSICSSSNLEPPTECIQQLVSGQQTAKCPMERIYEAKTIRKITEGNIMVTGSNITLSSNCSSERLLNGSFLIQYSNCTVKLDDEEYANSDMEIQPFIPTTGIKRQDPINRLAGSPKCVALNGWHEIM
ncbi:uncharacterized protein LOC134221603 [Armigeres subalbatus]|uniref:uncharacterized protein LOC134221603 n=1 Tax=Armigeres subalbatus TaxID=124917 RepID=UPI002ED1C01C